MTKKNRVTKAWQRNWELWMIKGIYLNKGKSWKNWLTPKQVLKELRKEEL